jgi:hypothetical protein
LGRKFKDLFIGADFNSVFNYVLVDVMIPAAKNMIVDGVYQGIQRTMYGESAVRKRYSGIGPRSITTYNAPVNRGYSGSSAPLRNAPPPTPGPRSLRTMNEDYIVSTREEGDLVLERMNDILEVYEIVSVADLNELVGYPTTHIDNKFGWTDLRGSAVRQVRDGFLIDLPQVEPIS